VRPHRHGHLGFGQRIVDITKCKPGAVICDVARPPDINKAEAALRPDVLVIESGEVLIPGDIDFGYNIGLPPKTAYACLAETALLAMEGRFEDYTLGRNITDGAGQGDLQAVAQAQLPDWPGCAHRGRPG
jgi:predicted amino acid dehydrogenase